MIDESESEFHHELIVDLDEEDLTLPRATQRYIAETIAREQMAEDNYTPLKPTHPHASRVQDGRWAVSGWWQKEDT